MYVSFYSPHLLSILRRRFNRQYQLDIKEEVFTNQKPHQILGYYV